MKNAVLIILVVLNLMVLSGQIWPENAPPFAGVVNLIFLVTSLLSFLWMLRLRYSKTKHQ